MQGEKRMKKFRSLAKRLTWRIVLVFMVMMTLATCCNFRLINKGITRWTQYYYQTVMNVENERLAKMLYGVEVASHNSVDEVKERMASPDNVYSALEEELRRNRNIIGFFAAFEEDYYPQMGRWFEPYAVWQDGKIIRQQVGSERHNYQSKEWYRHVISSDSSYWSEPYFDETGSDRLLCTYALPLYDTQGHKVGVFGADMSLEWLHEQMHEMDIQTNETGFVNILREHEDDKLFWTYSFIIGRQGTYISHPHEEHILKDNFFDACLQTPDTLDDHLAQEMMAGKRGVTKIDIDDYTYYVFYSGLSNTGWSMAIVVPGLIMKLPAIALSIIIACLMCISTLLIFFIFRATIRRTIKPLLLLTRSADEVAKGNFNTPLPELKHNDEVYQLRDSFDNMQQSLVKHIKELQLTTAQKAAIESELKVASDIQMSMLPRVFPPFPERKDIDLFASMTPAKEVGGDLYNFYLNEECLYFAVGDVSGKGVPASLFMAQATRLFRTLAGEGFNPMDIATRMNSGLCEGNDTMMFVTMFIGLVHLDTGKLDFCNCGHNPPVFGNQFIEFKHKNRPLGLFDDLPFKGESIDDIRGKKLLVYTDGLNEAMNRECEQFGDKRIIELLSGNQTLTACQVVEKLKAAVEQHRNGAEPNDDLTMLCLEIST